MKISQSRHSARKIGVPSTLTAEEWRRIVEASGGKCAYCGGPGSGMDHMTPMRRGGGNTADNVAVSCRPCNSRKGNRTAEEYQAGLPFPARKKGKASVDVDTPLILVNLKRFRKKAGMSQQDLAIAVKTNQRTISDWEANHARSKRLSLALLARLCHFFKVDPGALLEFPNGMFPHPDLTDIPTIETWAEPKPAAQPPGSIPLPLNH